MTFFKFLISKTFLKHLSLAFVLAFVIVFLTLFYLRIYTRHGKSLGVPDFDGMSIEEVAEITKYKRLRYEVTDSVYLPKKAPGTVIDQNPRAGFRVKKNRTIHLIINAVNPKQVRMPKVTDVSLRAAKAELEMAGLKMGKITFKPSHYHNLVIDQLYKGKTIKPQEKIVADSKVDLVVGRGWSNELTRTPDIIGLTYDDAERSMSDAFLNRGIVDYDETVKTAEDSAQAVVYHQSPKDDIQITRGAFMDIKLTKDKEKLPNEEVEEEKNE